MYPTAETPPVRWPWRLALAALVAWHAWMTLSLFGPDRPWARLTDDQPVLSGRHPLHLYHGHLGARALRERGSLSCYDPAFHAGYPKTPLFDSGSRPADFLLALAGGGYRPAVYKLGLAALCLSAPLLLWVAARGAGLHAPGTCLTAALGLAIWWGPAGRDALHAGDADLMLATLLALAHIGLLVRFHRRPGGVYLAGVLATGALGWLAHPVLFLLLLPVFAVYYAKAGPKHGWIWHGSLLGGLAAAVALHAFWLWDCVHYWWILQPLPRATPGAAGGGAAWGGPVDGLLALALVGLGAVGVVVGHRRGRHSVARLLAAATAGFLLLGVGGWVWEPLARLGAGRLVLTGLLFATVPAADAVDFLARLALRRRGGALAVAGTLAAACVVPALLFPSEAVAWVSRLTRAEPLLLGLDDDRRAVVEALSRHTTPGARVLWEDRREPRPGSRWTALLPLLAERPLIGGLSPEAALEHLTAGLADRALAGRPIREWSDAELADYCTRYNVGWVACWSDEARARLAAWEMAEPVAPLRDGGAGELFAVRRPHNYALTGAATWHSADGGRIVLTDVEPADGAVVLSLHHLAGMRVTPGRVQVQQEIDARDPVPFVRLSVKEHVARVTITWEKP